MPGYSPWYGIPYPNDYAEPADSPAALRDAALVTDSQMLGIDARVASKSPNGHVHDERYSPHGHVHDERYSPHGHGHLPMDVNVLAYTWNVGTLGPGQEAEAIVAKPSGFAVFVTVQHNSTYIHAVANTLDLVTVRLRCRNSTTSTTHTNVKVYYMFVYAAG